MFNKFQKDVIRDDSGAYIDLMPLFPEKICAFFIVDKDKRKTKEEIENFFILKKAAPQKICRLKQLHSDIIVDENGTEGDGLYTKSPGTVLTIAVADCVPILISANKGNLLIAIHSGWMGTYLEIAKKSLSLFEAKDCDAVWIGPSIKSCCYKVSEERTKSFKKKFPLSKGVILKESKLDLPLINAEILNASGVAAEKIFLDGRCSYCNSNNFASFRRDKEKAGRMVLAAMIKD